MSKGLARVAHKRRTKAQREDYDFNVKREAEFVRLLTSWGFQPVSEHGTIFTDGSVFALVALAQNFRGEWVAQANSRSLYRERRVVQSLRARHEA